jgi:glycosyltransferase involved in cell wall biosynthesis
MPSYNQAQYLEESICSVLGQDYPNLEFMIVDGGSKDGSVDIIKKYESRLAWWVSEKDKGQGDAINKGFSRANGEIIAWLNSDDLYMPGTISTGVKALQDYPGTGLIHGDVLAIDSDGQTTNLMRGHDLDLAGLMQFKIINQPSVFVRREVLLKSGFLDVNYNLLLDQQLWLRVAQVTSLRYIPRTMAAARYHPAAKNRSQASGYGKDAYRVVEWMSTQPGMASLFAKNKNKIWAGAYRYDGFYQLDAGNAKESLRSYMRAFSCYPPTALAEWHRILFAAASLVVNVDRLREWYNDARQKQVAKNIKKEAKRQ